MTKPGKRLPPALAWIPWWLSVIMAIVSYIGLKYLTPALAVSTGLAPLVGFLPQIAPLAAVGFLLFAALLLYDRDEVTTYPEDPQDPEDDQADRQSGENND